MQSIIKTLYHAPAFRLGKGTSVINEFMVWSENQDKNRFAWLAASVAGHGCVLTPATLFTIILSGNHFIFWVMAITAMTMCLVTNLAALPTKVTIPIFFFSILIDLFIITYSLIGGLDMNGTYI